MSKRESYTRHENSLLPQFRADMSHAESTEDVKKFFLRTVLELFGRTFEEDTELVYEDLAFAPEDPKGFTFRRQPANKAEFRNAWENSDLPAIVGRFADTAKNHYARLDKHPDRTEARMYNLHETPDREAGPGGGGAR